MLYAGDGTRPRSTALATELVDLTEPLGEADKDLVSCLCHVSYEKALFLLFVSVPHLMGIIPQALALLENLAAKRLEEASQARKIAKLEEAYTNLKIGKDSMAAGYRRLSDKY
jgi:hypothetical protein